jgi:hypothetical protein
MKVIIGEIWDFYLEFMDWKTTSLKNNEADSTAAADVDPRLEITLLNSNKCV